MKQERATNVELLRLIKHDRLTGVVSQELAEIVMSMVQRRGRSSNFNSFSDLERMMAYSLDFLLNLPHPRKSGTGGRKVPGVLTFDPEKSDNPFFVHHDYHSW